MAFGDWSPLHWDADHGWYNFAFKHPQNSAFIENVEIRIGGADDRIQQLIRAIDWRQVNTAMTR